MRAFSISVVYATVLKLRQSLDKCLNRGSIMRVHTRGLNCRSEIKYPSPTAGRGGPDLILEVPCGLLDDDSTVAVSLESGALRDYNQ
jgi:hypothetical protein